jgi:hypothetical protein
VEIHGLFFGKIRIIKHATAWELYWRKQFCEYPKNRKALLAVPQFMKRRISSFVKLMSIPLLFLPVILELRCKISKL